GRARKASKTKRIRTRYSKTRAVAA
ncbi:guanylate kinase family protein, partial [Chlamydia psittaci 06-1683]